MLKISCGFTQANVQMQTCTQFTGIAALSQTNNWIFNMWWNDGSAEPPLPEMQQSLFKMKRLLSDESPAYEKSNTAAASVSHCSNKRRLKSCWKSISAVIDWGETYRFKQKGSRYPGALVCKSILSSLQEPQLQHEFLQNENLQLVRLLKMSLTCRKSELHTSSHNIAAKGGYFLKETFKKKGITCLSITGRPLTGYPTSTSLQAVLQKGPFYEALPTYCLNKNVHKNMDWDALIIDVKRKNV